MLIFVYLKKSDPFKRSEENGKFKSIDDLKNVSGIGDAKFEAIKKDITMSIFHLKIIHVPE